MCAARRPAGRAALRLPAKAAEAETPARQQHTVRGTERPSNQRTLIRGRVRAQDDHMEITLRWQVAAEAAAMASSAVQLGHRKLTPYLCSMPYSATPVHARDRSLPSRLLQPPAGRDKRRRQPPVNRAAAHQVVLAGGGADPRHRLAQQPLSFLQQSGARGGREAGGDQKAAPGSPPGCWISGQGLGNAGRRGHVLQAVRALRAP